MASLEHEQPMTPERWERITAILFEALDRPADQRSALIRDACHSDRDLEREVAVLAQSYDDEPAFLDIPIVDLTQCHDAVPDTASERLGPYRVVRPLGHGGMGDVFLAIQETGGFEQSVAVKVIPVGVDSEEARRRFRLESRILAQLQHPHIAQLIDGGVTETGRPYVVMEYIEGERIDVHCDRHRLSLRRRLALFQVVCGAVQHAHQNLVVHRDLKPGNILVTSDGVPKLLDFGIGKILAPHVESGGQASTGAGMRAFTPEYAAPEQIRGEPVTTAADVYGLGVLLYELLARKHPYAGTDRSAGQIAGAVLETEPDPPSRLHRGVSRDLDTIVLTAMRHEPSRRYHSAAALAEDVGRYLAGLPVAARPATLRYRVGKFARRHAVGLAATAALLVALIGSSVVTLVQSGRVARERDRAIEERDKAMEVRGFLMEMFGASGADQAADTLTARQLLDLQARRLDETYAAHPQLRAEMMDVLADGYDRLGLLEEAETWARTGYESQLAMLGPDHPDIAGPLNTLGWVMHEQGRSGEALPLLERAVAVRRRAGSEYRGVLSRSLNDLGVVMEAEGRGEDAEAVYREALAIRLGEYGPNHRGVGITASNLAVALFRQGKYGDAEGVATQALSALQASVGADHQRSIIAESNLALMRRRSGNLEGAEQTFRDLVDRQSRLQGPDHPITAYAMNNLAAALIDVGKLAEAQRWFERALTIRESVLGEGHPDVAETLAGLGDVLTAREAFADAETAYQRALAIRVARSGDGHPSAGAVLADLARLYEQSDRPDRAARYFRDALRNWSEALPPTHPRLANLRSHFGYFLLEHDQAEEAIAPLRLAHSAALDGASESLVNDTRLGLAWAFRTLERDSQADSLLREATPAYDAGALTEAQSRLYRRLSEPGGRS